MTKNEKKFNWQIGTSQIQILIAQDYEVNAFSDIHFRINRRLDVWPSTKKWYDTRNHTKGTYKDLLTFAKQHFKNIEAVNKSIVK